METGELKPQIPEPPKSLEGPRRERLSDEKMGNLISAVGNQESKAILLGLMSPGHIYTDAGLMNLLNKSQGDRPTWETSMGTGRSYCQQSFVPIGLVAGEVINPDLSTLGYMKTDYGQEVGEPFVGLILDFSLRHEGISLLDIFGKTGSPSNEIDVDGVRFKKRSPITRVKILRELINQSSPMRTTDLERAIGEREGSLTSHLDSLVDRGIISYDVVRRGTPSSIYVVEDGIVMGDPGSYSFKPGPARFAYGLFRNNPGQEHTATEIIDKYVNSKGRTYTAEQIRGFYATFSAILSRMVREGYLKRKKFAGTVRISEIDLSPQQRDLISDLIHILDSFQDQDEQSLAYGKRRLQGILQDPQVVGALMEKSKEHSSSANKAPIPERKLRMISILTNQGKGSVRQIHEQLQHEGIKLSRSRVQIMLKDLEKEGRATSVYIRGIKFYSPK